MEAERQGRVKRETGTGEDGRGKEEEEEEEEEEEAFNHLYETECAQMPRHVHSVTHANLDKCRQYTPATNSKSKPKP